MASTLLHSFNQLRLPVILNVRIRGGDFFYIVLPFPFFLLIFSYLTLLVIHFLSYPSSLPTTNRSLSLPPGYVSALPASQPASQLVRTVYPNEIDWFACCLRSSLTHALTPLASSSLPNSIPLDAIVSMGLEAFDRERPKIMTHLHPALFSLFVKKKEAKYGVNVNESRLMKRRDLFLRSLGLFSICLEETSQIRVVQLFFFIFSPSFFIFFLPLG